MAPGGEQGDALDLGPTQIVSMAQPLETSVPQLDAAAEMTEASHDESVSLEAEADDSAARRG